MTTWTEWIDHTCRNIDAAGQWRRPRSLDSAGTVGLEVSSDQEVVSFASNDYLGLSQHPVVKAAARDALERWGTGSGSSRLIVGTRPVHEALEEELASWRGTEAAVVFPTGFAANLGVLSVLAEPGVRICSDELNHASIIDGCRSARARGSEVRVYRHGDLDHLRHELEGSTRAVVVTDTVFSMDGDVAPVHELASLCAEKGALLVLDEAHAVLGPPLHLADWDGSGLVVARVGTLSKALGSLGGFVAGPRRLVELIVNRARSYIFTTASTPADTAAALAAVGILGSPEGDGLIARLRANVERVRHGHPSPIIPVIIGGETEAVAASAALLDKGLLVPAIRPPTVPPGTSRLRIALSAAHTDEQVSSLLAALGADPESHGVR